ncbi:hypothetical protein J7L18_02020 [Candidatus Bathyarchaeota archaeon]|nr:hypothetical protein [Candidatus Bathyarchaeota archaeon]
MRSWRSSKRELWICMRLRFRRLRGWLMQTRGGFRNRIEDNVAERISKSDGPAEEVPCTVIEKCKREVLTFIQSLQRNRRCQRP